VSRQTQGCFVTGTDTGVGKTEIACALIRAIGRLGVRSVGMKPVAAGARRVSRGLRNADVVALEQASPVRAARQLRNPYVLAPAIAPHLAAKEAGVALDIEVMARAFRGLCERARYVVVEGAGGFRVPLDERFDMADLAERLRLPVVLVVGMRLGCISHALLTAEAIERRGLTIAGWVANRIDPSMRRYRDNVRAVQERLHAPLLADVPHIAAARARRAHLDAHLDVSALLAPRRRQALAGA
jgi:dethiobiotin synthetase